VVRIEATRVQNGVGKRLDIWKQQLRPINEFRINPVNGPIPAFRLLSRDVSRPKHLAVSFIVIRQSWVVI